MSEYLQKNAELAAERVGKFCEEAARLPKTPLYSPSTGRADAAELLATRVDWATEPPIHGSHHLPDATIAALARDGWEARLGEVELGGLDFSWMRELLAYDSWDLTRAGPASQLPPGEDLGKAFPNYLFFVQWSKLRLAHAFRFGDFLDASRELRHVASILDSQHIVLAQVIAVIILRNEERAYQVAAARGLGVGTGWAPIASAEDLDRRRRIDRAAYAFFTPGVAPEVMARALACAPSPCASISEGAWSHATVGELAPEDTRDAFAALLARSGCESPMLARILAGREATIEEAQSTFLGPSPLTSF